MAGMIIGRRMRARKLNTRMLVPGGRWRYFIEVEHHDLHSTKGWRLAKRFRVGFFRAEWEREPQYQEHFVPAAGWPAGRIGSSDAGRWMRNRGVLQMAPHHYETIRKRHIHPRSKR